MDTKFYVPYETARLLREKCYPQSTDTWYVEMCRGVRVFQKMTNKDYEYIARPTYHEVLDWLFGMGWFVYARYYLDNTYFSTIYDMSNCTEHFPTGTWTSREEALNAAILEALRLYI